MSVKNTYEITKSPFYKLTSKNQLLKLLLLKDSELQFLLSNSSTNYHVFPSNGRLIQSPQKLLRRVHSRIFTLLKRISQPEYVFSGIKGKSNISNAQEHLSNKFVLKVDIEKFFSTTQYKKIYAFFYEKCKCSVRISKILAELCQYQGVLPTGSPISMVLAYWAHCEMFDEIYKVSKRLDITMTVYVDDITFSTNSRNLNDLLLSTVSKIIRRHGLKINKRKIRFYNEFDTKLITGVAINSLGQLDMSNRSHYKLHHFFDLFFKAQDPDAKMPFYSKIQGLLSYQMNFNSNAKNRKRTLKSLKP